MSLFASRLERRLWSWAGLTVVAIGASAFLAQTFLGVLVGTDWPAILFLVGMLLVGLTIATHGLTRTPGTLEITGTVGLLAVYFMVGLRMALETERSHLIEYSVLAIFIFAALSERRARGRRVPYPAMLSIVAASLVGVLDELLQILVPGRVFDLEDILFNSLAAVIAVLGSCVLTWLRSRFPQD